MPEPEAPAKPKENETLTPEELASAPLLDNYEVSTEKVHLQIGVRPLQG